jgi:exodeoxyribonuclease VII large subunit
MTTAIKKVTEIVSEIKSLLESEFNNVSIEGEVSNLSLSSSGHWYFTLSDKDSSLSAALFKMDALRNPQLKTIKDGSKVVVVGDVNVYPKRGTFQVIVKRIVPIGTGDLKEQYEKLKRKLAAEGLFDIDRKKVIPSMPKRVAILTAQRGAALQDFLNIYKRRSLWMDIVVVPTLVQGDDAPRSIRNSLHNVIKYSMEASPEKKIDLIVLARGGGSLEDLWAFNDEGLAYDIFNCPIPTISAIGHEVDYSICDFVSDMRCETPSAAAEVITHQQTLIKDKMINLKSQLLSRIEAKRDRALHKLENAHPRTILSILLSRYSAYQKRLQKLDLKSRLHELTNIHDYYLRLDDALSTMQIKLKELMVHHHHKIDNHYNLLQALNPKNVMQRGYSFLVSPNGKVINSTKEFDSIDQDKSMVLNFYDGTRKVKSNENQ